MVPNFDRSTVKHVRQNIENACHQWLSRSFRVHHTLYLLLKNKVVFLRSVCCNNVFSLGQTDGYRYHDSTLPKTSWCTKFGQFILRKIIKIVASSCQILSLECTKIRFRLGHPQIPLGGGLTALPRPPSWIERAYF